MGILTKIAAAIESGTATAVSATTGFSERVALRIKASQDAEYIAVKTKALEAAKRRVEVVAAANSVAKTERALSAKEAKLLREREGLKARLKSLGIEVAE